MSAHPPPDFANPPGAPSHLHPGSVQWRIYKNGIAMGVGGTAAVLMEFADPRIRSGVWDHSTYKVDPIARSKRTGQAALLGCYGAKEQANAVIRRVNQIDLGIIDQFDALVFGHGFHHPDDLPADLREVHRLRIENE
mgnify:CR=1 FL=1